MHEAFAEKMGEEYYELSETDYDEAFQMAVHKDVRKGIVADEFVLMGVSLTRYGL